MEMISEGFLDQRKEHNFRIMLNLLTWVYVPKSLDLIY